MEGLEKKIKDFIADNLIIFDDDIVIENTDNIFEKGFVNSLFAMKLLNYIEKEFSFTVENDELSLKNFSTVENICNLINKKLISQA